MTGTLAIWYEPVEAGDPEQPANRCAPQVELHFNLWRDTDTGADFFDIGVRLNSATGLGRLFLFVPTALQYRQLSDLSSVLKHETSLNAVFNDLVGIREHFEGSFTVDIKKSSVRIHELDISRHLKLEPVDMDSAGIGTVIAFTSEFCRALQRGEEAHYIRFRIQLNRQSSHLFSTEVTPSDWFLLPSFQRMELTEFRFNERRSLPRSLLRRFEENPLEITTIHYFLIRAQQHELIVQHRDFRKIRVLEAAIWRHYLKGKHPEREVDVDTYRHRRKNRHIIYHWRERSENTPLEDFNAFAKFSTPQGNLLTYAYTITFLGGLGSALYALVYEITAAFLRGFETPQAPVVAAAFFSDWMVALMSLVFVIGLFWIISLALSRSESINAWFDGVLRRLVRRRD